MIDEKELGEMSTVIEMTRWVNKGNIIPYFIWCLRDFSLDSGKYQHSDDYLEIILNTANISNDSEKYRVRKQIAEFFRDRSCLFFVRPVNEEEKLREIEKLQLSDIRPEFKDQLKKFRELIFANAKPKRYDNKLITGSMYIALIEEVLFAFNNNQIPEVSSSMERVLQQERTQILETVKQKVEIYITNNIEQSGDIVKEGLIYLFEILVEEATKAQQQEMVAQLAVDILSVFFQKLEKEKKLKYYHIGQKYENIVESILSENDISLSEIVPKIRRKFEELKLLDNQIDNKFAVDKYLSRLYIKLSHEMVNVRNDLEYKVEELTKDLELERDKKDMQDRIFKEQKKSIDEYKKKVEQLEQQISGKSEELILYKTNAGDQKELLGQLAKEREKVHKLEREVKETKYVG